MARRPSGYSSRILLEYRTGASASYTAFAGGGGGIVRQAMLRYNYGSSPIAERVTAPPALQIGAIAAAEESGHYYHSLDLGNVKGVTGENSTLTCLAFLNAVKKDPALLDKLQALQATSHG